jgi:hypothetical protein
VHLRKITGKDNQEQKGQTPAAAWSNVGFPSQDKISYKNPYNIDINVLEASCILQVDLQGKNYFPPLSSVFVFRQASHICAKTMTEIANP